MERIPPGSLADTRAAARQQHSVQFDPDGKTIVSKGSGDGSAGTIKVWDAGTYTLSHPT